MVSPATTDDFDAIAALNVAAYQEFADRMSPEHWETMKANIRTVEARASSTQFLVVREHGAIVGSVGYCQASKGNPGTFPSDWATIVLLAVSPTVRGRGIGRALVSTCIARARQDSAPIIGLYTSELMIAAQHLYESLGFQRECRLPPRLDLCYWRYQLRLRESLA